MVCSDTVPLHVLLVMRSVIPLFRACYGVYPVTRYYALYNYPITSRVTTATTTPHTTSHGRGRGTVMCTPSGVLHVVVRNEYLIG